MKKRILSRASSHSGADPQQSSSTQGDSSCPKVACHNVSSDSLQKQSTYPFKVIATIVNGDHSKHFRIENETLQLSLASTKEEPEPMFTVNLSPKGTRDTVAGKSHDGVKAVARDDEARCGVKDKAIVDRELVIDEAFAGIEGVTARAIVNVEGVADEVVAGIEGVSNEAVAGMESVTDEAVAGIEGVAIGAIASVESVADGAIASESVADRAIASMESVADEAVAGAGVESVANGAIAGVESVADGTIAGVESVADGTIAGVESVADGTIASMECVADEAVAGAGVESVANGDIASMESVADEAVAGVDNLANEAVVDVEGMADGAVAGVEGVAVDVAERVRGDRVEGENIQAMLSSLVYSLGLGEVESQEAISLWLNRIIVPRMDSSQISSSLSRRWQLYEEERTHYQDMLDRGSQVAPAEEVST